MGAGQARRVMHDRSLFPDKAPTPTAASPIGVQAHRLGEMLNPLDIASVHDWGPLSTADTSPLVGSLCAQACRCTRPINDDGTCFRCGRDTDR